MQIDGHTLCRCSLCNVQVKQGDLVVRHLHSAYKNSMNIRYAHMNCILLQGLDKCGFVKDDYKDKLSKEMALKSLLG